MNLVLGFVPFILFAILMGVSIDLALWVAFAAAFALGMRSFLDTRVLKTLDAGSTVLFGGLALFKGFVAPALALGVVMLIVDGGLLIVMVVSLVLHEPFTLQYAREQATPDLWDKPRFLRANYVVTAIWVLALTLMTAADATATFTGRISLTVAIGAGLVALAAALTFSVRYTAYMQGTLR